jgi:hypothetical protein
MNITRRLLLRSVPPAVAAGTVVATPFVAEAIERKSEKTRYEQALYHIRELKRLAVEDGVVPHKDGEANVSVIVIGTYADGSIRGIHDHPFRFCDWDGMFRDEGAVS